MPIVAITNQKGGVGKTTTAVNLAACLAAAELRTLLVDADPQGNATSGLGVQTPAGGTLYDALSGLKPAAAVVRHGVAFPTLDLIPADPDLAGAEVELVSRDRREHVLAEVLNPLGNSYDLTLVDCPPSLGLLTINVLAAADFLLIPLQCEYFALEGLSQLLRTVELVKERLNPRLHILGVLLTMYDARLNLSRQVAQDARAFFGDMVFATVVPRNIRLAESPSFGKPIIQYDISSVGAAAYLALSQEVTDRLILKRSQIGKLAHAATVSLDSETLAPVQT